MTPAGTRAVAEEFVSFLNKAVTPFHAVDECAYLLKAAGFAELEEGGSWKGCAGQRRGFVRRNGSCLVAWAAGGKFEAGNSTSIIAAHTDSPCLKVKPVSELSGSGYLQLGVQTYGGGLWRTWFDRDLTLAGRVLHKNAEGGIAQLLVNLKRPILSIPNLAIHLETDRSKFEFKKEEHLRPILATLHGCAEKEATAEAGGGGDCSPLLRLLSAETGLKAESILSYDLHLVDVQPAGITGLREEFVSGGRLDNLVGTYTAVTGLIDSLDTLESDSSLRMVVAFDNEEVGSVSAQGAASALLKWILRRLHEEPLAMELAMPRSFLISADQAHAIHPNYAAKHDQAHRITMGKGVVVKVNANQRYATSALTHALLKLVAEKAEIPLQDFVVTNDSPCGSTVGPMLSASLGIPTIDVGTTQLAMHSIREKADILSIAQARRLYAHFFRHLPALLPKFS